VKLPYDVVNVATGVSEEHEYAVKIESMKTVTAGGLNIFFGMFCINVAKVLFNIGIRNKFFKTGV
jgi:hypothetical protein